MKKYTILFTVTFSILTNNPGYTQEFKKLDFNKKSIIKNYLYEGEVIKGEKWLDKNGNNTLILTQKRTKNADEYKDEIFAYHYVSLNNKDSLLWKYHDSTDTYCDKGEGIVMSSVRDSDDNGIAEASFIYNIVGSCDVSPRPYYLIINQGKNTYSMRNVPVLKSPDTFIIKTDTDKNLKALPKAIYNNAYSLWKENVLNKLFSKKPYIVNENYSAGKYPKASTSLLNKSDIQNKSQAQLMINEIYARHGYEFKNKSVSEYFSKEGWNIPFYREVAQYLTKVEESNIKLLSNFK